MSSKSAASPPVRRYFSLDKRSGRLETVSAVISKQYYVCQCQATVDFGKDVKGNPAVSLQPQW